MNNLPEIPHSEIKEGQCVCCLMNEPDRMFLKWIGRGTTLQDDLQILAGPFTPESIMELDAENKRLREILSTVIEQAIPMCEMLYRDSEEWQLPRYLQDAIAEVKKLEG